MLRMKTFFKSGTSTISKPGALKNDGPLPGLQWTSGGYRSVFAVRYSYTALAHGCIGTSAARGMPPRPGLHFPISLLAGRRAQVDSPIGPAWRRVGSLASGRRRGLAAGRCRALGEGRDGQQRGHSRQPRLRRRKI